MRFADWIAEWFAAYSPRLESTTVSAYSRIVDRWRDYFGPKKLSSITPSDVEKFCVAVMQPDNEITGEALSANTVQRHLAVLKRACRYAVRDGLIPFNPVDRIEPPKAIHKEIELPDVAETQAQVDALKGTALYLPVCIALLTGMRRSEIMGLCWDCVDLAKATVAVKRVRQRLTKKEVQSHDLQRLHAPSGASGS